jgi:hypothetical protein
MNLYDIVAPMTMSEAQTDYQKRRQRERDIDAGKPVPKQRQSSMTDYQKRRAEQKRQEALGENSWSGPDNAWSSEHNNWTAEDAQIAPDSTSPVGGHVDEGATVAYVVSYFDTKTGNKGENTVSALTKQDAADKIVKLMHERGYDVVVTAARPAVEEGWSNKMVAQRTGQAPTPYSVYIKGKEWKSFADDDHAENVANKLRAKFKQEGRDPSVITIAPTGYDKGMEEATNRHFGPKGAGTELARQIRGELANIKPSTGTPVPAKEFTKGVLKDLKTAMNPPKIQVKKNKGVDEVTQRLDPKCWKGKHKEGTKIKGGVRVNNCVPNESVEEALSKKDLVKQVGDKLNDPEFRKKPADPNKRWEKGDLYQGPGPDDYGYTGYQGHGMPTDKAERARIRADKKNGVAEMDKSQKGAAGWNIDDYPLGAKGTTAKPTTVKNVVKSAAKDLDAAFNQADKKKPKTVKENYWTKLQNERNKKLNSLVNELKESIKK